MDRVTALFAGIQLICAWICILRLHQRVHNLEEAEQRRRGLAIQAQEEYAHYLPFNNEQD